MDHAATFGVEDAVVVTGEVTDEALRVLYQRCAAFVFPSLYEGFGLPILEAMQCGAAVIVGNNSSQIEIVADTALLTNAGDTHDIKDKIAALLDDPALSRTLGDRASNAAKRTHGIGACGIRSTPSPHSNPQVGRPGACGTIAAHVRKPRIAFFSPLPPRKSGISDYSAHLLEELRSPIRSTCSMIPGTSRNWRSLRTNSSRPIFGCLSAWPPRRITMRSSTRWATRAITVICIPCS